MDKVVPQSTPFIKYCILLNKLRFLKMHTSVALRVEDTKEEVIFVLLHTVLIYNCFGMFSTLHSLFLANCFF